MAKKKDKYGSPYDPNNEGGMFSGKRPKPPEQKREEQISIGPGCGNPDCASCYPETAGRGFGRLFGGGRNSGRAAASFSRPSNNPFRVAEEQRYAIEIEGRRYDVSASEYQRLSNMRPEEMTEYLRDLMRGRMDFEGFRTFVSFDDAPAKPAGPPQSYKDAREEVKEWIVAAPEQSFEDIVGNEEALAQLRDAIEAPIKYKELYEAYGLKMPKGALLSGPPGCGKTMFAKAAVSEMKRLYGEATEFISLAGSEIQAPFVGVTEEYIRQIFTFAREYKAYHGHPLVVFIDEAEVILPDRTGRIRKVAPWEESNVATFLTEMDGMQESGAFVLLASNRPEVIDSAVLRDGRCDFKIMVEKPTWKALEGILLKNFVGYPLGTDPVETLVFAAMEAMRDPHKVLIDANVFKVSLEEEGIKVASKTRHFLLEHILSGAMAAGIPARAARHAFNRDKESGQIKGVLTENVIHAVNALFEENKRLDHSYYFNKFRQEFIDELNLADKEQETKDKGLH